MAAKAKIYYLDFLPTEASQNLFCGEGNTAFLRISETKACGLSRIP